MMFHTVTTTTLLHVQLFLLYQLIPYTELACMALANRVWVIVLPFRTTESKG